MVSSFHWYWRSSGSILYRAFSTRTLQGQRHSLGEGNGLVRGRALDDSFDVPLCTLGSASLCHSKGRTEADDGVCARSRGSVDPGRTSRHPPRHFIQSPLKANPTPPLVSSVSNLVHLHSDCRADRTPATLRFAFQSSTQTRSHYHDRAFWKISPARGHLGI